MLIEKYPIIILLNHISSVSFTIVLIEDSAKEFRAIFDNLCDQIILYLRS
jgi:hypothetical protein